jgi:outer membrane protein assembly factor BamA
MLRNAVFSSRRLDLLASSAGRPVSVGFPLPLVRLSAWMVLAGLWMAVAHGQVPQSPGGVIPLPPTATPAAGAVDEANRIVEVRIEGNHATDVSKLPKLVTRAGQIFDAQAIEEDVRTLHRCRKFVDIHPKYVRVKEGVVVIFQVVERPMLRYVKYVAPSARRRKSKSATRWMPTWSRRPGDVSSRITTRRATKPRR